MAAALREAAEQRRRRDRGAGRRRGRLAGRRRREDRRRLRRAEPARLGGQLPARRDAERASSAPTVRVGNDVQVATEAEFQLGAGTRVLDPDRRLLGHRRRRRARPRRQALARPRRRRRDRPHGRQARRRQVPLRAQGLHGGLRRAARRWKPRRAASTRRARKTDLFKLMEKHEQTAADQRHLGAGARPRRPPRRGADRPRDRGARHRRRLGRQPARPRSGDHRRRPRRPLRRALHGAADQGDGQAPLRRRTAARGAGRLARRPRRRDRRLAASFAR